MKPIKKLIDTAMGRCLPDIVLKQAQVYNVFTGSFSLGDVAITDGYIVGIGSYQGKQEIDVTGQYITPGFIDAHVHIESSMVSPEQFARVVVPAGTTTVVADAHEIANVLGVKGLDYMLAATEKLPLSVYFMLPSCVPATAWEHAGAELTAEDLATFMQHPRVLGLGEMMDFPGVLAGQKEVLAKLVAAAGKKIDGHAPGLSGRELTAYIAAGVQSDHECMLPSEASERLAQGMHIMLREGSAAKNLLALLPAVTAHTMPQCMLATDDRHLEDLVRDGHINSLVRMAVEAEIPVAWAINMATINSARYFGIENLGAVAPGYRADILVFDNLTDWQPSVVIKAGKLVLQAGRLQWSSSIVTDESVKRTVHLAAITKKQLHLPAASPIARVIGLVPHQLVTELLELTVPVVAGGFTADPAQDIVKLAVWERHRGTGQVGVSLLRGLGLERGAIASTVAHDSHNLIVAGTNDQDMLLAVQELERQQGGIVVVDNNEVLGVLALPIAGLMSDQAVAQVEQRLQELQQLARQLGVCEDYDPFMTLAFLSLPVIPAVKLTDMGLVDVAGAVLLTPAVL